MFSIRSNITPKAGSVFRQSQRTAIRLFATGEEYDVAIIGGGPGGYVAAIKAAQLGLKTICIERRGKLGGTCLNVGCIPSKSLLHNSHYYHLAKHEFADRGIKVGSLSVDLPKMMQQKNDAITALTGGIEGLFKKNKITYLKGHGTLTSKNDISVATLDGKTEGVKAKNIILATGSDVVSLPGVTLDEKIIVSSTGALNLDKVPKQMIVIGGGVIGLELGSVWSRLGAEVTVVEFLGQIGGLNIDVDTSKALLRTLKAQGLKFMLETKVTKVEKAGSGVKIDVEGAKDGAKTTLDSDVVLVSVGRRQFTDNLGLEKAGIEMDGKKVKVNNLYQTNVPHIYAIGDIVHGPMLAHKAEDEGVMVSEFIKDGKKPHLNFDNVPSVIYTSPEVAWVGKTEEQLKAEGVKFNKGKFLFAANSRAKCNGNTEGFAKVLTDATTDRVLGVHIMNDLAGELISEAALAVEYGASGQDLYQVCRAHPTQSEALKGAAQISVLGKAINM